MKAAELARVGEARHDHLDVDALIVSSEQRLTRQADELVLLVDATKVRAQSSMILAPLSRVARIVTDDRIGADERRMVEDAGVGLIVVDPRRPAGNRHRRPHDRATSLGADAAVILGVGG